MKLRILTAIGFGLLYAQVGAADTATNQTQTVATPSNVAASQSNQTQPMPQQTTSTAQVQPVDKGKVSYSIGVDLGENFKAQGIDIDTAMLEKGLRDSLAGNKLLYTKQEMSNALVAFQKQLLAKQQAMFNALSTKNDNEGTTFLTANKNKPGIITTTSGLQYKVITPGNGGPPTDSSVVTVDYTGTFINGQVFDSSYQRGKPVTFPVAEVIPGWTEALKLMQPGATFEIYVPPSLAYGDRGLGNIIGPKQTLIFKIHLISIKPAA